MKRLLVVSALTAAAAVLMPARSASAHPLGNFSVNHYDGLRLSRDRVDDTAVVDSAEIPTAQLSSAVDTDGDGRVTTRESSAYATRQCDRLRDGVRLTADGIAAEFTVRARAFTFHPGAAGLRTSRLTCQLRAAVDLGRARTVAFIDDLGADRVGWHEITAAGDGVRLDGSPVPAHSISHELRRYPNDLLASPLDVRKAVIRVVPSAGPSSVAAGASAFPHAGPLTVALERVNGTFDHLVGRRHLTLGIGLAAVALALLLGASHALLPGHGKTVMAAYIAGRRGSVADAVVVGATVTATHTAGVLVLGLALSASASLAGESVLRWLGVISGLMIAALGTGLLIGSLRRRRGRTASAGHHHHDHHHIHGHSHEAALGRESDGERVLGRKGLVGMGIAGGLVPSPSALVVLLAAIALGRTIFGVALVIGYGLGMAATLTAAGLILVKVRDRYLSRPRATSGVVGRISNRWVALVPLATAGLVIVVGLGLAARSVSIF